MQLEGVREQLLAETQEDGPRGRAASGGPQGVQGPPCAFHWRCVQVLPHFPVGGEKKAGP